jgi:hypothetical protein
MGAPASREHADPRGFTQAVGARCEWTARGCSLSGLADQRREQRRPFFRRERVHALLDASTLGTIVKAVPHCHGFRACLPDTGLRSNGAGSAAGRCRQDRRGSGERDDPIALLACCGWSGVGHVKVLKRETPAVSAGDPQGVFHRSVSATTMTHSRPDVKAGAVPELVTVARDEGMTWLWTTLRRETAVLDVVRAFHSTVERLPCPRKVYTRPSACSGCLASAHFIRGKPLR